MNTWDPHGFLKLKFEEYGEGEKGSKVICSSSYAFAQLKTKEPLRGPPKRRCYLIMETGRLVSYKCMMVNDLRKRSATR